MHGEFAWPHTAMAPLVSPVAEPPEQVVSQSGVPQELRAKAAAVCSLREGRAEVRMYFVHGTATGHQSYTGVQRPLKGD